MSRLFKFTSVFLLVFSFIFSKAILAQEETYTCVWRNPERTMNRLFPEAKDYRTVTKKITTDKLNNIEKRLGSKLLPGQREVFQYFEMLDVQGNLLGYVLAASQKGEYGAIEFVLGLDLARLINGIYIQRAREKDAQFKKKEFLEQFVGKGAEDERILTNGNMETGKTPGTFAVIMGIRKELITLDEVRE